MPLDEEKKRIVGKETYRAEARARIDAETQTGLAQEKKAEDRTKLQQGCLGAIVLLVVVLFVTEHTSPGSDQDKSPSR